MIVWIYIGSIAFCVLAAVAYVWFELALDAGKTKSAAIALTLLCIAYIVGPVCSSALPQREPVTTYFESETRAVAYYAEDVPVEDSQLSGSAEE